MDAPFDIEVNRQHAFAWAVDYFNSEDMARAFVLHLASLPLDDQEYIDSNGYRSEADHWAQTDTQ